MIIYRFDKLVYIGKDDNILSYIHSQGKKSHIFNLHNYIDREQYN